MYRALLLACALSAFAQEETCVSIDKAKDLLNRDACVVGRVVKVADSRAGNTFLNFCSDYRSCPFSAVQLHSASNEEMGDMHDLEGKVVELHGIVKSYEGKPEIELKTRDQVRLVKDEAKKALAAPEPEDMRPRMHQFGGRPHVPGGFGRRSRRW